ncbi:PRC-barrel domain-containing protein [Parafrankia elaeagni]|uniref:PRC-barrel domain-containing protein n=1 Tax=Parafrankia elaeagni TaxID=222534 RepID=UPI00037E2280|nr:PRC-barrel domain-containing protein [Parafrankia elaeagni]
MLFSEAAKRRVLSTKTAQSVGVLAGFVVDPTAARIAALRVKKSEGPGDILGWEDLTAFGQDVITVASAEAIADPHGRVADLLARPGELLGKRILTDAGNEIGTVTDVDFDPAEGKVLSLLTTAGRLAGDRLVGCGSYAVVVREQRSSGTGEGARQDSDRTG